MTMTSLQANDVVRLRNTGTTPWKGTYASQKYSMQPGGECIVPFIAACNFFGHPDAVDIGPRDRYRTDEYARLRIYYGVYDDEDKWESCTPNVAVFDLDGNRIITVIDDPAGEHLSPTTSTIAEKALLENQLAQLTRQVQALSAALDNQNRSEDAINQAEIIEPDLPPASGPLDDEIDPDVLADRQAQIAAQQATGTPSSTTVPAAADVIPPRPPLKESPNVSEDTPTRVKVSGT